MATTLQLRRGTAAEAAAFTGAQGELFIDVDNKLVYLHDGSTAGGLPVGSSAGAAVVSGAVSGNTLTLTNSDATTVNINVSSLNQDSNTFVTNATISGSVITLHNNDNTTVDIHLPSSVTGFLPSEITEDMLPQFDAVYDLGSTTKRWFDINASNSVAIGDTTLTAGVGKLIANTEVVATSLTSADLVTDEALIGTVLHAGSTITPEGISTEYAHSKGTLSVDGNLSILDDLNVRNKIALKQAPVTIGTVTETITVPAVITPTTIDNTTAQQTGFFRVYFTNENNFSTFYFYNAPDASNFANSLVVGSQLSVNVVQSGMQYSGTLNVSQISYNPGWTSVDVSLTTLSGTAPWNVSAYNNWYWSWYDGMQPTQMGSISYNKTTPASYTVKVNGTLPTFDLVNKLYINGSSTVVAEKTFATLNDFVAATGGTPMAFNNFGFVPISGGHGITISYMSDTTPLFNYLAQGSQMVFTANNSVSWTLKLTGLHYDMMFGQYLGYEVLSTSNPTYADPSMYANTFSSSQAGFSITLVTDIKSYLSSATTSIVGTNEYVAKSDITAHFAVGSTVAYTTKTTSIVFGDTTSGVSKAITYDETTGKITYDGLVSALNIDTTRHALYSADSLISTNSVTPGEYSISIGNSSNSSSSGEGGVAVGASAAVSGYHGVAIGYNARSEGSGTVSVGNGNARGNYSTYVGRGGDGIGAMYHSTVLGMVGDSSSGWMWGGGQHVMTLGTAYLWVRTAGDYSTLINGGGTGTSAADYNMVGGSTWFAPQERHGEFVLSVYQYAYVSGAGTVYPQLGYGSASSVPYNFSTSARTSDDTTINVNTIGNNSLTQGKITVTVMRRNAEDYGIYEITFVARRSQAGVSSIVQQTTTVVAQSGASTYWGNPQMYLSGNSLQLSMTTTAAAANNYISVHVGGPVRTSGAY